MVTKEQALTGREFHWVAVGECKRTVGPRGGITERITKVRANGKCKTWKKDPSRFRLPIMYGMYDYGYIEEWNADCFHLASECPLLKEG
jgi:hypothetical protein